MAWNEVKAAVLLVDITGSTPLYEAVGDTVAMRQITHRLEGLRQIVDRQGGSLIRSKGDDVLCAFADPGAALRCAREMLAQREVGLPDIHAGLHFGKIIRTEDDIFGDAVNVTARLAQLAKPGEFLISQDLVDELPDEAIGPLRVLDNFTFKGKEAPTAVYSLAEDDTAHLTEIADSQFAGPARLRQARGGAGVTLTLTHGGCSKSFEDGASLSIGRARDCDLVVLQPWVSRCHATLTLRHGMVHISDESLAGTYLKMGGDSEIYILRESAMLVGAGLISPAVSSLEDKAEIITYEVVSR